MSNRAELGCLRRVFIWVPDPILSRMVRRAERRERILVRASMRLAISRTSLCELDQTALRIVPGKQEHEPVLEEEPNEFGRQFTQHAPGEELLTVEEAAKELPNKKDQIEAWPS